jgi:hypothetical protein
VERILALADKWALTSVARVCEDFLLQVSALFDLFRTLLCARALWARFLRLVGATACPLALCTTGGAVCGRPVCRLPPVVAA